MQLIYAAPFLIAAAILFTILAAIPKLRRFAIIVPTGIIAFGPGSLIGYIGVVLIRSKIWGHNFPADWCDGVVYGLGGLIAFIEAAIITRLIVAVAPVLLVRIIVFAGAFWSYFVLAISALIGLHAYITQNQIVQRSTARGALILCLSLLVSGIGAWFISRRPNEFRISKKLTTTTNVQLGE